MKWIHNKKRLIGYKKNRKRVKNNLKKQLNNNNRT